MGCEVLIVVNPSVGPVHTIFKITVVFACGLNSTLTVQVRLTADLMGRTGLEELVEIITEVGGGTA